MIFPFRLHKLSKTHFAKLSALRHDWPMTCHLCGMESLTTSNLNEHMISGHLDFVSQCYTCGELFPIPQQLAAHIRNYCNRRNPTKNSLRYKLKEGINCNVASCEFVGKNFKCNRCQDDLESEANVIIHIKSVHIEEVRKMFAIDASEHLEADEEYHLWLNAITEVNEDKNVIRNLENKNRVLLNRVNEKNKDTFKHCQRHNGPRN